MSYINLFYIFIVLAIVLLILSVVLFFVLDIPNAIRIVNKKAPKKKRQNVKQSNTTDELKRNELPQIENVTTVQQKSSSKKKTTVLPANQTRSKKRTTALQQRQATLESQPQPSIQPKSKTTVLQNSTDSKINKKTGDMNANNTNNDVFEVVETTAFIASDRTI